MAYTCPQELDGFMPHLVKQDIKFRQQLGADLLTFLAEPSNSIVCQDIGQFIDNLIPWLQNCNHKVTFKIATFLCNHFYKCCFFFVITNLKR